MMNKHMLPLSISLLLALLLSGCPDPMGSVDSPAPADNGYLWLRIEGAQSSRTIMPVMSGKEKLFYTLEFVKSGTTKKFPVIGPVPYTSLSKPVLLEAGTWELTVSAFNDEAGQQMIAQVKKTGINIGGGKNTTTEVTLKPITTGSGQGTFKWDINFPSEVSMASMTITKTPNGTAVVYYFKGDASLPLIGKKDSVSLGTGYYVLNFEMTLGKKKLERKDILHIYQNLESSYTNTFTESNFFADMSGIEVDPLSKATYDKGEPLDLSIYAKYSDGTYSFILMNTVTSNYDPEITGEQNITITHTDTGFTTVFKVTVTTNVFGGVARIGANKYATLNAAIAAANGSADSPTEIVILVNIKAGSGGEPAGFTIPENNHIKFAVESGKSITINNSAGGYLFTVNAGSSLTLGGTLTLNGDVFVAGLISLSGNAQLDTLTLSAGANGNGVVKIDSSWSTAYINKLNLYGSANTIAGVIALWEGKTVLQGPWLNASNIENMNFKIWNFIDATGHTQRMNTPQLPDVAYGYAIDDGALNAADIGKLRAGRFNIYLEAQRYKEAATNITITVPHDYIMPRQLIIPAPGVTSITLTIKGNTATTRIKRGTQDATAINGLFQVESGRKLEFEGIIIDGNYKDDTDNIVFNNNAASLVRVNSGGTFTMNAGAVLQNNRATNGGGVYNGGTFTMSGGEIKNNTATGNGGGMYSSGTFNMSSGKINSNTGRGVSVSGGTFTMNGGEINSNTSGGVSVSGGTFNMNNGKINNNTGGGVSVSSSYTFKMEGGEISGNTGVGVTSGGTSTINNGTISGNAGGVSVTGGTLTMNSGTISGNTATNGGGVNITGGTFTMNGGIISGNTANGTGTNGGGGVYVSSGYTFNMYGGEISGNKAASNGGGVYNNGTFRVGGTAKVSGNTKTDNTTKSNASIAASTYITLGTGTNAPAAGMSIGVQTARQDNVVVSSGATGGIKSYFTADEAGQSVYILGAALLIGDPSSLSQKVLKFYEQVETYGTATADMTITVDADLTLPIPVNIPAPVTAGIKLTIKGNPATTKLIRGTEDATANNGLFIVPSGVRLEFEDIIIDGNYKDDTDTIVFSNNAASLVRVNSGGIFTMNAGAVLQNNRATNGGGVYNAGTFNMNGGEIKNNTATTNGSGVYSSGTFNMSSGEISGNTGRGVYVNSGTFTMSGGEINSNTSGGVSVSGGTFNMNNGKINNNTGVGVSVSSSYTFKMEGGEISGNTGVGVTSGGTSTINNGTISGNAGGVTVTGGTLTMNSGTISGNTATNGGGVNITGGTFTMNGGIISGNTANGTGTNGGGGVYVSSGYTFNMYGGEISGNKAASNGGGVYNNGTFRVGGTAKVSGNTKTDNSNENNVYVSTFITLGTGTNAPTTEMEIWVQTARADGVVVQSGADEQIKGYFKSDDDEKEVNVRLGQLIIGEGLPNPPPQNVLDFYKKVETYGTATANMTITVDEDLELPYPVNIPAPGAAGITLTIKGNTATTKLIRGTEDLTANNGLFIVPSGAWLEFEDIIIDGDNLTHTGNTASLVRVYSGGIFTMNAGAVLQNNRATNGGGVYNAGTFNMNGGEIKNNTATTNGSGVYSSGTFNMSSGKINSNTGRGVSVSGGTFTMSGGEINSNTSGGVSVTGGTFNMNNGKINNNTGVGVSVSSSYTFKMEGGEISGNTGVGVTSGGTSTINNGTISGNAGGVSVTGGTFTMNDGTISGNTATNGGGVNITGGTFTMNDGTISSNTATNGGGVYVSSGYTFNMYGGEISGNTAASNGGGVYNNGTFRVGGTAKVSGNTKTDNTTKSNAFIAASTYITLGTETNVPAAGMEIWVQTAREDKVIVQHVTDGTLKDYFKADESEKSVVFNVNALMIQ